MRVNRSGTTSRGGHGNEAVPTRLQGTGTAPAQGNAHAGARGVAGRSGANAGSQPADDINLGQEAGRGPAGVAAQATGTPRWFGCGAKEAVGQGVAGGCGGKRFSDRAVDAGAGGQGDRAPVWADVQHGQCLAHPARDGFLEPATDRACHPTRRSRHRTVAQQALAGAKKSPAAKGGPSSSSTKAD